ncbi:MAG TPA: thiamine pyrophosphate-binding protein [Thermoanaerobaculia bacterium]|nr:thiamine pyrophosphate-binding protein [Thermoanaerobaculia bacterium]
MGVADFCVCAGSRNSPLLAVVGAAISFVDERSAAFFALGRAKRDRRPVAVITTSGTAVAELLPAAIEAYYSATPLIFITADRPARYRGTGAPQAIEQVGIFGVYAETDAATWSRTRALHINVEFDEPLIDDDTEGGLPAGPLLVVPPPRTSGRAGSPPSFSKPLVIVGGLSPDKRERVRHFVNMLSAPVYAEPLSGLRESLDGIRNERMLARGDFDGVIRIGNVPTLRFWRDLDERFRDLPVVHFSDLPFAGLPRGDVYPIDALPTNVEPRPRTDDFLARDQEMSSRVAALLDDERDSEPAMLRDLANRIPANARIYLGNSLPIREWDLVAPRDARGFELDANRGANGIDGQLSTFFGWCVPSASNWCIAGDLTTIYDLNAPWVVPQLDAEFRIVIINNGGGRIFSRVPSLAPLARDVREHIIENTHSLRFESWAAMWGISDRVIELRPDSEATSRFWSKYDELWR